MHRSPGEDVVIVQGTQLRVPDDGDHVVATRAQGSRELGGEHLVEQQCLRKGQSPSAGDVGPTGERLAALVLCPVRPRNCR